MPLAPLVLLALAVLIVGEVREYRPDQGRHRDARLALGGLVLCYAAPVLVGIAFLREMFLAVQGAAGFGM
ncbi:MAG: hypothetical protein GY769_16870 [bacterium]|nr:hypothetical protein [bacterium]